MKKNNILIVLEVTESSAINYKLKKPFKKRIKITLERILM